MNNEIYNDDCLVIMDKIKDKSIHLVFTSPPYFNARPEYSIYEDYKTYLEFMEKVIKESHRLLVDGRFFVINVSPVLIPRRKRSEKSTRIAIPFDLYAIFMRNGYEFIDDIIWEKPEYTVKGRNRRFFVDRKPLQYKPSLVTEYVLVFRKKTDKLIEWNVKKYSKEQIENSKIIGDYESSNIWKIKPQKNKDHPAVFPEKLAENIIKYYSFVGDRVFDPFAGIGTTGMVCEKLNREYLLTERNAHYFSVMKKNLISLSN